MNIESEIQVQSIYTTNVWFGMLPPTSYEHSRQEVAGGDIW